MPEMLPHLEIRLLGPFRVLQGGKPLSGFRDTKARELLTLLVLADGSEIGYDQLAYTLSGMEPEQEDDGTGRLVLPYEARHSAEEREAALRAMRVCLHRLKKGRSANESDPVIDNRRFSKSGKRSIVFDISNTSVDVLQVQAASESGTAPQKQAAVLLYAGDLLPGCTNAAIMRRRSQLRTQYRELLEYLSMQAKARGEFPEAIRYQTLLIENDPHNEDLVEQLMDLQIRCGNEVAARDVYHKYADSLGRVIKPGASLHAKLSTLNFSVSVPQTNWSPSPFARISGALPPIVGRESDVLKVQALLDKGRFVTLKGMPGVGKTLLALHAASQLSALFNHRVVFIDLTTCRSLEDVQRHIIACFGATADPHSALEDRVVQSAGKERLLMVLDNCEQVIAHTGPFLMDLLYRAPKLKFIATSHIPWRSLPGENVVHVKPLAVPHTRLLKLPAEQLANALREYEAVRLYLSETASIQPGIQLTQENAHVIARLVSVLDGLPLAIKLAAGTSHTLTPEQMLDRMDRHGFDILEDRLNSLPKKHESVNTALSIAYDLLPMWLRSVFASFAVFRAGWTLEAAEAIGHGGSASEALIQLQERSLVSAESVEGKLRFSMLEMVHRFVRDKLDKSDHCQTVHLQHANFYLRLALQADPHLKEGPNQAEWLRSLRHEAGNIAAALDWCLSARQAELGLQLANAHWRVWYMSAAYEEGYNCLHSLLESATPDLDPLVRLKAVGAAGIFALRRADYSNARHYFLSTMQLADLMGRPLARANACGNLGNVESFEGNYAEAERRQFEAIAIYEGLTQANSIAIFLGNLASNATRSKDAAKSIDYGLRAAAAFREAGDEYNVAVAIENLAEAYIQLGRCSDAIRAIAEALTISERLSEWRIVAECHVLLLMLAVKFRLWYTAANLIGMHGALHTGRELPLTSPHLPRFGALRQQTEAALGSEAYHETIRSAALLEPEQCAIAMRAVCTNLKDTISKETGSLSLAAK